MTIRKVRRGDHGGRPVLFLEIDGVPGFVLDEQRLLRYGVAVISGEAAGLFPPIRVSIDSERETVLRRGGADDPELVRLVWDFILSNVSVADRGLLVKPPRAILDTTIDIERFRE